MFSEHVASFIMRHVTRNKSDLTASKTGIRVYEVYGYRYRINWRVKLVPKAKHGVGSRQPVRSWLIR